MTSQPFAVPALLFFIAAVPLILGLIPRNRFYGVRAPKTLSDDKVWYPVNRIAATAVMLGSGVYGIVAALLPYDPLAIDNLATWAIHLAAFTVPLAIALSLAIRYAKRF